MSPRSLATGTQTYFVLLHLTLMHLTCYAAPELYIDEVTLTYRSGAHVLSTAVTAADADGKSALLDGLGPISAELRATSHGTSLLRRLRCVPSLRTFLLLAGRCHQTPAPS